MKTSTVPAQVTTVEDRVAANLSLKQLVILISTVFIGVLQFLLFLPAVSINPIKAVVMLVSLSLGLLAAVRVREQLMLDWSTLLAKYIFRPKYYIINKNDEYLRQELCDRSKPKTETKATPNKFKTITLPLGKAVKLQGYITENKLSLSFVNSSKKGVIIDVLETR